MRIRDLRTVAVRGWIDWLLVRVDTDEGISGYGEAPMPFGHVVETYRAMIKGSIKPRLLGQDPMNVERLYERMGPSLCGGIYNYAVSSMEMALWDIAGKSLDVPIYRLLGGKLRDKIRVYADCHAGEPTRSRDAYNADIPLQKENYIADAYARHAREVKKQGYRFLKFDFWPRIAALACDGVVDGQLSNAGISHITTLVRAVREAVGDEIDLAADLADGGTYKVNDAIKLINALEPANLTWVEDAVSNNNVDAWSTVTASVKTPTLAGGTLLTRWGFREFIEKQAVRILHPDVTHCGGLLETKKIADMANLYHMPVAIHNTCSPIGTLAAVQVAAALSNFLALEIHHLGTSWWNELIEHSKPLIEDGYISVPEKPGFGAEPNERAIREHLAPGEKYFE